MSSIYSYNTADKAWRDIDALRSGKAIFTQPAGVIKCAGGEHACHPHGNAWQDISNEAYSAAKNHVDGVGPVPENRAWRHGLH